MQQELGDSAWNHNGEKPEGRPIIARRFIAGGWGNVISSSGKVTRDGGSSFQACLRHAHLPRRQPPLKWRATIRGPSGTFVIQEFGVLP